MDDAMGAMTLASGARAAAHGLLGEVLTGGRALDEALAASRPFAALAVRDRAFCRLLVATTLRRLGQTDELIEAYLDRPLPREAAAVRDALRLGAAQIVFLGTPPHAAVNETVALLRGPRLARFRGLANAVLRRMSREGAARRRTHDEARINTPDWLWRSWEGAYGEAAARAIARAHLAEPPMDITVKDGAAAWAARLDARVLPTGSLRRATAPAAGLPGFAAGAWWVQDMAAALPARVLMAGLAGPAGDWRIADLCAAPGGKTAQLAAAGGRVTALDVSARRLARVAENLARLGLAAELVAADLRRWTPDAPFDGLLLDAPCTGTGTIRRRPDIARNKRPGDVARLAGLQQSLLEAAACRLRPGGRLVYSVCSLQPEECAGAVDRFLARDRRFSRAPLGPGEIPGAAPFITPAGDIRTLPCHLAEHGGLDGFYICRLRRST